MDRETAAELIIATGRQLLKSGLVARTWGNISCRLDEERCAITPSGLDYKTMKEENITELNINTGKWSGTHKPSGEKGVHIAAYKTFPHAGFVIHTHQKYATAIGLAGFEGLDITKDEMRRLGGLGLASYGLPGTGKLTDNVENALHLQKETVLMAHHGALICGKTRDEAMDRAELLEEVCKRNVKGLKAEAGSYAEPGLSGISSGDMTNKLDALNKQLADLYPLIKTFTTPAVSLCADRSMTVYAQMDDMAQMIGKSVPVVTADRAQDELKRRNAVIVSGLGAVVRADNQDDIEALSLLVDKACICRLHTEAYNKKARLSSLDVALMNYIYRHKYSKQKLQEDEK